MDTMRTAGLPNLRAVALPVRAIRVRAEARMPKGHPHASWAHVGASWPVVPASDDAIQLPAVEHQGTDRQSRYAHPNFATRLSGLRCV